MGSNGLGGQPASGVADAGHSGVGDHGDAPARLERLHKFMRTTALVVLVATHGRGRDLEVVQQLLRLACVFAGYPVSAFEYIKGAQRNVAQVADRRGDQIKAGGER